MTELRTASVPAPADEAAGREKAARLTGALRTARPKQWAKNVLVLAAPGAAGVLTEPRVLRLAGLAFVAFCLAASGTYFVNDAIDVESDRVHPKKRLRPVAAGTLPTNAAWFIGLALVCAGVAAAALARWELALVVGAYAAVTIAYSLYLKHQPVFDLVAVASGFVLRAIGGGVATNVPISQWFFIVASFGSLFIVAGKRHGELLELGDDRADHRATLATYSEPFLRYVRSLSSAVAIAAYCLWAFEKASGAAAPVLYELSIVPFVLGILRYALRVETGAASAPEDIVLGDIPLLVVGGCWIACFGLGVYFK